MKGLDPVTAQWLADKPTRPANPLANFLDPRLPDRFWNKVQPCPVSGCWLWTGSATPNGYGQMQWNGRAKQTAHRLAYVTLVGEFPRGLDLDHLCRVRCCCNPAHLEPVTRQTNASRGVGGLHKREIASRTTHCAHGHEFTPENTRRNPKGHRQCRTCDRERLKAGRDAARALRSTLATQEPTRG